MASITLSAAELLLHRLQALDVAYIFINSGTDYPPVIEAWAKARATGQKVPELVICPHETPPSAWPMAITSAPARCRR